MDFEQLQKEYEAAKKAYDEAKKIIENHEKRLKAMETLFCSGYTPYTCPHPLTGLTGTCSSDVAGRAGYNLSSGVTGIGSGGTASMGPVAP